MVIETTAVLSASSQHLLSFPPLKEEDDNSGQSATSLDQGELCAASVISLNS